MVRSVCKNMNPFEIQNRFSDGQGYYQLESTMLSLADYEPFLKKLPEREQDLIEMYYRRGKKQKEIAEFFGVTQGGVSHRLSRAIKRLKFLRDMPKLENDIEEILSDYFEPFDIDLIKMMIETTCQSYTANLLNEKYELKNDDRMTQVKVRHRFNRCIQRIEGLNKVNKNLKICNELLEHIKDNLYMLHEVKLPHFNKGYYVKRRTLS